jgi:hypothetical protein
VKEGGSRVRREVVECVEGGSRVWREVVECVEGGSRVWREVVECDWLCSSLLSDHCP